jgi:hypothetical protein
MVAVAENGGRIRPQVRVVKALASALCIGGGGSVGRKGPTVQIGSALGSTLGQLGRMSEGRLRVIVGLLLPTREWQELVRKAKAPDRRRVSWEFATAVGCWLAA